MKIFALRKPLLENTPVPIDFFVEIMYNKISENAGHGGDV